MATTSQAIQSLLDSPAMAAPPGLEHNFVNPPSLKTEYYVDVTICFVVSVVAVGIRMWTKVRLIRKVHIEDYFCVLALAIFTVYCGFIFYTVRVEDVGAHQWNVQIKTLSRQSYLGFVGGIIYSFVILTIKLAILLQYLRILSVGRDTTFWVCHVLIWVHIAYYLIFPFLKIFQCYPVEKQWKPWIEGRCMVDTIHVLSASINSASDIFIFIVPQKVIWNLQLSLKKKIGVSAIFIVALLACISSLVRLYYTVLLFKNEDSTYYFWLMVLWTTPEMASAFLAISLPVFPKYFRSLKASTPPFSWKEIPQC